MIQNTTTQGPLDGSRRVLVGERERETLFSERPPHFILFLYSITTLFKLEKSFGRWNIHGINVKFFSLKASHPKTGRILIVNLPRIDRWSHLWSHLTTVLLWQIPQSLHQWLQLPLSPPSSSSFSQLCEMLMQQEEPRKTRKLPFCYLTTHGVVE